MSILITGGAGYIGSHTCVEFLSAGHEVVVVDSLEYSNPVALDRVGDICGTSVSLEQGDIRDQDFLEQVIRKHKCSSVVHFAGLKVVGESIERPLDYYDVNVNGTYRLLKAMDACDVRRMIFSSSANVYGVPIHLPCREDHCLQPVSPYGRTKLVVENMLRDLAASDGRWSFGILRYFNPVGAHGSGLIGEDPVGIPNNLMPHVARVAMGQRERLDVYGNDYDTPDGTGVRDYIHVVDLARGHIKAHSALDSPGAVEVNLGTGRGYSVLELMAEYGHVSNRQIPHQIKPRRPGDVATSCADVTHAQELLGWKAEFGLHEMCRDSWNWMVKNPGGYGSGKKS